MMPRCFVSVLNALHYALKLHLVPCLPMEIELALAQGVIFLSPIDCASRPTCMGWALPAGPAEISRGYQ
jgi:hypothetical protein